MRIRWRGLELPTRVVSDQEVSTPTYGRFSVEPFERGFGITVGNSLRRILLSSLEGASVTSVKIKGAGHEFSSLPGVKEDVTDIILNVKNLVIKSHLPGKKVLLLHSEVKGPVTAGMIEADPAIELINTAQVIATLTDDELAQPQNGIWLCGNHARVVDTNQGNRFPPELLLSYKRPKDATTTLAVCAHSEIRCVLA